MVNPGAFLGSRKAFLEAQKRLYADAVTSNHVADTVADIQRRYFKRYPVTLPHNEEPTQEWLDGVDDSAPDPEIECPNEELMDPNAYASAKLEYEKIVRDLKARKDQIKRRLAYQHNKDRDEHTSFEKGSSDPLAILTAKLTGESIKKPRMRTAYNVWGPEHRFFVDPVFKQRVIDGNVPAKNQAALRSAIYKEMFNELPEDEQRDWANRAESEHEKALEDIQKKLKAGASTNPEDRQRVIQALPKFFEPILDLVAEHSGWKLTLIAGGPEPADGGRLNMVSIHSGVTTGSVKMDFGRSERKAYRNYIIPTFGTFLKKCFSVEECRSRALPTGHDLTALSLDEDVDVYRFDLDPAHIQVAHPSKEARKEKAASSTTGSAQPLKFGPPIGRKKQAPAPTKPKLPSPPAATPPALAGPTATPQSCDQPNVNSASISNQHPSCAPSLAPSSPVSRAPTPVISRASSRVPTPAPSRTPSRVPTPVSSRSPSSAPSIPLPQLGSQAPSKAASPLAFSPLPPHVPSPEPEFARPPSQVHSPSPRPCPVSSLHASRTWSGGLAGTVPLSAAATAQATLPVSNSDVTQAAPSQPEPSASESSVPETISTNPTQITSVDPPPCPSPALQPTHIPLRDILLQNKSNFSTPAGAATVPDPSTLRAADRSSRKSRKRKVADENEGVVQLATKRTRSNSGKLLEQVGEPALKKQKQSEADNVSKRAFDVTAPAGCPPWVNKALNLLAAEDFGESWRDLVHTWLKFEAGFGFKQEGRRLGSQSRPPFIADWIQRARSSTYRPDSAALKTLEADFEIWWRSLQPRWRIVERSPELQRGAGDWESLRCSGQNGLLSVVAALFFWGIAAVKGGRVKGSWRAAVSDVSYALTELL